MNKELNAVQEAINDYKFYNQNASVGELSDGYHTFNELYHHRTVLLALALRSIPFAWRSKKHEDGTMFDGMFIVGAPTQSGMITYHCDNEYWDLFKIPVIPHAPHFDGHTPNDVLDRLTEIIEFSSNKLFDQYSINTIEEIVKNEIFPVFGEDKKSLMQFVSSYGSYIID